MFRHHKHPVEALVNKISEKMLNSCLKLQRLFARMASSTCSSTFGRAISSCHELERLRLWKCYLLAAPSTVAVSQSWHKLCGDKQLVKHMCFVPTMRNVCSPPVASRSSRCEGHSWFWRQRTTIGWQRQWLKSVRCASLASGKHKLVSLRVWQSSPIRPIC